MREQELQRWAERLAAGEISVVDFVAACAPPKSAEMGDVMLDLDRQRRCGFPEVVFGEGKEVATLGKIFQRLLDAKTPVLATRVSAEKAAALLASFRRGRYNSVARTFRIDVEENDAAAPSGAALAAEAPRPRVAVLTAGTSDLPVAEEARETLEWMGINVTMVCDVGVAGPHRLPARLHEIQGVVAVVVVAGMEGALPSVVGGYVSCPVVGVPTSVGYGANLGGVSALLSMLNSCAANVTVVNIDAGFKGGYVAGLIAKQQSRNT